MSAAQPEVVWFAIGLRKPDGGHCGLIYESEGRKYLHFAWDRRLLRESSPPADSILLVNTDLTETNKKILALIAEAIFEHPSSHDIPYSLDYMGVEFDAVTNEFRDAGVGTGLSCATFVVAVLKRAGFRLMDVATWQSDAADGAMKAYVIKRLTESYGEGHPHIEAMKAQTDLFRIRPLDVAGAGEVPSETWPAEFAVARANGEALRQSMNR